MTSHIDLQRDIGRMEGKQDAMGDRLDKLEKIVTEGFAKIHEELAELKNESATRKGERTAAVWIAGSLGALVTGLGQWVIDHFAK